MRLFQRHKMSIKLNIGKFSFAALLLILSTSFAKAQEKVNWISFEEMIEKQKVEQKKVFIDIYTDWCGWCKKMDEATFQQPHIAAYLNENYYSVKFNAEQKSAITWKGNTFEFTPSGRKGFHKLAFELTRGKLSYPTIVFLDEAMDIIQPIPGYRAPEEFDMIMHYFGEDAHKSTSWKIYSKNYRRTKRNNKNKLAQPVKYKNGN